MDNPINDQNLTPNQSENKWIVLILVLAGLILGISAGYFYSGRFLILYITERGPNPLLEGDAPNPPRVGFNYLHNLTRFPDQIIRNPGAYELIHVQGGRIKALPPEIGNISNLKSFIVSDNRLTKLPDTIGNLSNIEELYLGGNRLTSLPSSIGNLINLKRLYLYNNQITSIPGSIGNLTNLEVLDLHSNSLTTLPAEISGLTHLKTLYLGGNKITKDEQNKIQSELPNTIIYF